MESTTCEKLGIDKKELQKQIDINYFKEWRSKKMLDEYLTNCKNDFKVLGYVTKKTLQKWGGPDHREDYLFILQKGNRYYYFYGLGKGFVSWEQQEIERIGRRNSF